MKKYLFLAIVTINLCATNAYAAQQGGGHPAGKTCPPCLTADNGDCQAPCGATDTTTAGPKVRVGNPPKGAIKEKADPAVKVIGNPKAKVDEKAK